MITISRRDIVPKLKYQTLSLDFVLHSIDNSVGLFNLLHAYFLEWKMYYFSLMTELEVWIWNICLHLDQIFFRLQVFNSFCEWKNFESFLHPKRSSVLLISLSQPRFQFEVLSALLNFLCFKLTGNIRQSRSVENFIEKLIPKKKIFSEELPKTTESKFLPGHHRNKKSILKKVCISILVSWNYPGSAFGFDSFGYYTKFLRQHRPAFSSFHQGCSRQLSNYTCHIIRIKLIPKP